MRSSYNLATGLRNEEADARSWSFHLVGPALGLLVPVRLMAQCVEASFTFDFGT